MNNKKQKVMGTMDDNVQNRSEFDIQTMGSTSKIDEYTSKAEIAIAEIPKKSPLLANYLGLDKTQEDVQAAINRDACRMV